MSRGHVFISYSSSDRDVADLLQTSLEAEGRAVWIAPRDVPPGFSYPEAIIGAIRECEVGLLVLSEQSNNSQHVLREVERISSDGKPLFVLRVDDVEPSDGLAYFASVLQWLEAPRDRLVQNPASVLRPILSTEPAPGVGPPSRPGSEPASTATGSAESEEMSFSALADAQRRMLTTFGVAVLDYICQQPNPAQPVPRRELLARLIESSHVFDGLSPRQFESLLANARAYGCVPGLSESEEGFFVVEENISVKRERNRVAKGMIASHAARLIRSGMTVAVDGGSTTSPLVEAVLSRVEMGELDDLTIVTNSLTIAQSVSEFMSHQGWTDESALISLYMVGGIVRPNTHATTWGDHVERESTELLEELEVRGGPIDIGFVGGNGFGLDSGITMGSIEELGFKRFVLESAKVPYIVADSSKAGITLPVQIATWTDGFTLLTNVLPKQALQKLDELVLSGQIVEVRE